MDEGFFNFSLDHEDETFPNGHKRSEYHELGITDSEIEFWGLDQFGAPDPLSAGMIVMDEDVDF
jgi:hypothetical protein